MSDLNNNEKEDEIDLDALMPGEKSTLTETPKQESTTSAPTQEVSSDDTQDVPTNYDITFKWSESLTKFNPNFEFLTIAPTTADAVLDSIDKMSGQLGENDDSAEDWVQTIGLSLSSLPHGNRVQKASRREGAKWTQAVSGSTGKLKGTLPTFKHSEDTTYTGDRARLLVRSTLRLGTLFQVPLWHSGFWVTLRSPSESELLELERRIVQHKSTLGRQTYGLLFSNTMAYTNDIFLDFILEHVYNTSLNVKDDQELRKYIRLPDISILIWGLACATWPGGFQYRRPCIASPDSCHHVLEEKLNLAALLWTDESQLTQAQIKHMSSRSNRSVSVEQVAKYVDEFTIGQNRLVELTPEMKIIFRIPLAQEHIDSGIRWVMQIEETYGRAMAEEPQARDAFLTSQAKATALREFAHCVAAVQVGNTTEITDKPTIENILNDLTARDDLRSTFTRAVGQYLDDSLISFVGIPSYECPSCGKKQPISEYARFPEVIALDVTNSFFRLLVQRTQKIRDRTLQPVWGMEASE